MITCHCSTINLQVLLTTSLTTIKEHVITFVIKLMKTVVLIIDKSLTVYCEWWCLLAALIPVFIYEECIYCYICYLFVPFNYFLLNNLTLFLQFVVQDSFLILRCLFSLKDLINYRYNSKRWWILELFSIQQSWTITSRNKGWSCCYT